MNFYLINIQILIHFNSCYSHISTIHSSLTCNQKYICWRLSGKVVTNLIFWGSSKLVSVSPTVTLTFASLSLAATKSID